MTTIVPNQIAVTMVGGPNGVIAADHIVAVTQKKDGAKVHTIAGGFDVQNGARYIIEELNTIRELVPIDGKIMCALEAARDALKKVSDDGFEESRDAIYRAWGALDDVLNDEEIASFLENLPADDEPEELQTVEGPELPEGVGIGENNSIVLTEADKMITIATKDTDHILRLVMEGSTCVKVSMVKPEG